MTKKGCKQTEEHRRKISEANKNRLATSGSFKKGHEVSEEVRKKLSESNKGRSPNSGSFRKGKEHPYYKKHLSKEHIHNKSIAQITWLATHEHPLKGYKLSKERREEIHKRMEGEKNPNYGKRGEEMPCYWGNLPESTKKRMKEKWLLRVIPFKDTLPERMLQDALSSRGYAYYKHYPTVGQPDIAFPDQKIAIFADGDYWHKITKAIKRDKIVNQKLQEQGWLVLRYWECEIKANVEAVVDEIEDYLIGR